MQFSLCGIELCHGLGKILSRGRRLNGVVSGENFIIHHRSHVVIGDGGRSFPLKSELSHAEPVVTALLLIEFIAGHSEAEVLVGSTFKVIAGVVGACGHGQRFGSIVLGEGSNLGVGAGCLVGAFNHHFGGLTVAGISGGVEHAELTNTAFPHINADVVVKSVGRV